MNISVLIIAHNEEKHIQTCIDSVLMQSVSPHEICVVAHNCTDHTEMILRGYGEALVVYHLITEETGPIPAREYGFQHVSGDIVVCLDGDSFVDHDWLRTIIEPFTDPSIVSVAGYPILLAAPHISHLWFLQGLPFLRKIFHFYFWGGNFACRKSAYDAVGGMQMCRMVRGMLGLHYPAEDCILSFALQKLGGISFVRAARSYVPPGSFFDGEDRGEKQKQDLLKIKKYFFG